MWIIDMNIWTKKINLSFKFLLLYKPWRNIISSCWWSRHWVGPHCFKPENNNLTSYWSSFITFWVNRYCIFTTKKCIKTNSNQMQKESRWKLNCFLQIAEKLILGSCNHAVVFGQHFDWRSWEAYVNDEYAGIIEREISYS